MFDTMNTDLVYNIVEQTIAGSIDGVSVVAQAVSGDRAGSKLKGVVSPLLANNPYATGIKKSGSIAGGTQAALALKGRRDEKNGHSTHEQTSLNAIATPEPEVIIKAANEN